MRARPKTAMLVVAVLFCALHPGLHSARPVRSVQLAQSAQSAPVVLGTAVDTEVRAPHPRVASRTRSLATPKPVIHKTTHKVIHRPVHYGSAESWARSHKAIGVANCESGPGHRAPKYDVYVGDIRKRYRIYSGKWQFSPSTWRSVGGVGMPYAASEVEQDYRAWLLWKRDGWAPWECGHQV